MWPLECVLVCAPHYDHAPSDVVRYECSRKEPNLVKILTIHSLFIATVNKCVWSGLALLDVHGYGKSLDERQTAVVSELICASMSPLHELLAEVITDCGVASHCWHSVSRLTIVVLNVQNRLNILGASTPHFYEFPQKLSQT